MPLFRKQSQNGKKRLQHQVYLAKEAPEKTYDISSCEITDIPSGTYSVCKVLQKEALIAHTNWLSSLKGGGNMQDLSCLRVLDLHNNELVTLPEEIGHLRSLQVLNVECNKLKHLPQSIDNLTSLQTLNASCNKLKDIPDNIQELRCLRTLNLSKNSLTKLPKVLCHIRTLENLMVDIEGMQYPPPGICAEGCEAIMMFLCSECGLEYESPSKYQLDVLDGPKSPSTLSCHSFQNDMEAITEKVVQYELAKAARQQEIKYLEHQLEEDNRLQARMAAESAKNKKHLLDCVAQDQERLHDELASLQTQKDYERKRLIEKLYDAEQNASYVIEHLLELSEKAKKSEELLEKMEKDRIDSEEWFKVRQEEEKVFRKKEVLTAMEQALASNEAVNKIIQHYMENKDEVVRRAQMSNIETEGLLEHVLHDKSVEQQGMIDCLLREEKLQKEAFTFLQLEKDHKHQRITNQISMIHQQLTELSLVEREHRDEREQTQKDVLEHKRLALTDLLVQLMKEKSHREHELQKRMLEMEEQREANQTDYWLVQYQRLMDKKPQNLIDQETKLEFSVINILQVAQAVDYIPVFAYHRITIETLCTLTDQDLKQMGMHELGLRKAVLRETQRYMAMEEENAAAKLKKLEDPIQDDWVAKTPTAEEPETTMPSAPKKSPMTPTSPPLAVIARGIDSECVVCLDRMSNLLFLNCGHVCSCQQCAEPLEECPMCRSEILQRILLA